MMPSAQPITMITPPNSKPKIGFSIDSIVGNRLDYQDDSNDSHPMKRTSPTDSRGISRLSESSDQDLRNNNKSRSPSPTNAKAPIVVPGIPAGLINRPPMLGHHMPPYDLPPGHPHFLQFQAAAALVHAQAAQSGFAGNGPLPQHLPHLHNPNMPRDSYPLYPWLLSRHGRIFPHRFPGSE